MNTRVVSACVLALVIVGGFVGISRTDDPPRKEKADDAALPDLVGALRATPGCLGVETAQTASGKSVIFAWFENRKAVMKWFYSDVHQAVVQRFFPDFKRTHKPLADVPDDSGPIMVVASLTLAGKPTKEKPLPFKQIAVEMYQPMPGGLALGGKFAPEKMKVPERAKDKAAK
jgi:heme-degrading monooxygenase HmoA